MKVKLLTKTPKMLELMYAAAHACYSSRTPEDIFFNGPEIKESEKKELQAKSANFGEYELLLQELKRNKMLKTVRGCIARNHNTVMRHANFSFSLSGVSRAAMAQFTRHRAGIYSDLGEIEFDHGMDFDVQSQRYVTMDENFQWALPAAFFSDKVSSETAELVSSFLAEAKSLYRHLLDTNTMHKEDARYLLPNATPTNITCTANLAAILHLYRLRAKDATGKAQDEIKDLVNLMAEEVRLSEPWLAEFIK